MDYLQMAKMFAYQLAIIGKPIDGEDPYILCAYQVESLLSLICHLMLVCSS